MSKETVSEILSPGEVAKRMGITTADLVAMIRRHRYDFTEIKAGGKPGDRGKRRWGLTESQAAAISRGQRRTPPDPNAQVDSREPARTTLSPDGKSRIPRAGRARM